MATEAIHIASSTSQPVLPLDCLEPHWYAAYTCAQHEKRVAQQLDAHQVTNYLPLYETVHRWKDRRKLVQLPLFPGYVFVWISLRSRLDVLRLPGVVRLVGFNGTPTPLPEHEVEGLRRALTEGVRAEPHPHLRVGRRVRITRGPLLGREGILKRWKGALRVVLSLELIQRSILLDIEASSMEPIDNR
jgi:transcription antitermination factor NusG